MVSFGIPGTDYEFTTDSDEADVVSTDDVSDSVRSVGSSVESGARSVGGYGQDAARAPLQGLASVPASISEGEATLVSGDELGESAQSIDEGITSGLDRATEAVGLDDSRVVSGTRTAGDVLIGEGVRNVAGTTTGVDIAEGDADFETDRWAALDTALTVGTAGVGGAAARGGGTAARGLTDDIGGALGRLTGSSADDAGGAAARFGDDGAAATARSADDASTAPTEVLSQSQVARAGEDAIPTPSSQGAAQSADESGGLLSRFTGTAGDDVGSPVSLPGFTGTTVSSAGVRSADDAASTAGSIAGRTADDSGSTVAALTGRTADEGSSTVAALTGRTADDATGLASRGGQAGSRGADDAGRGIRDAIGQAGSRAGQAGSRASDAAGSAASRLGQAGSRVGDRARSTFLSTRPRQAGTLLGGGFLGALGAEQAGLFDGLGSALEDEEQIEVEDEQGRSLMLHMVEQLDPTEEHPNGGQLREVEEFEPDGQWSQTDGYTVLLDIAGNTVTMLGPDGEPMQAEVSAAQVADAMGRAEGGYYDDE